MGGSLSSNSTTAPLSTQNDGELGFRVKHVMVLISGEKTQIIDKHTNSPIFLPSEETFNFCTVVEVRKRITGLRFIHDVHRDVVVNVGEIYPRFQEFEYEQANRMQDSLRQENGESNTNALDDADADADDNDNGYGLMNTKRCASDKVIFGDIEGREEPYEIRSRNITVPPSWPEKFQSFGYYLDAGGVVLARLSFHVVIIQSFDQFRLSVVNLEREQRTSHLDKYTNEREIRQVFDISGFMTDVASLSDYEELSSSIARRPFRYFEATDGVLLSYKEFRSNGIDIPRAYLLHYHHPSRDSHIHSYLCERLCRKKNVVIFNVDLRGHGRSGGAISSMGQCKCDVKNDKQLLMDIRSLVQNISFNIAPNIPIVLVGFGLTATVIMRYTCWSGREPVSGVCAYGTNLSNDDLEVPGKIKDIHSQFGVKISFTKLSTARLTQGLLFAHSSAVKIKNNSLVHTIPLLKSGQSDSRVPMKFTPNYLHSFMTYNVKKHLRHLQIPYLFIQGEADEIIDVPKFVALVEQFKSPLQSMVVVPQVKHLQLTVFIDEYLGNWLDNTSFSSRLARNLRQRQPKSSTKKHRSLSASCSYTSIPTNSYNLSTERLTEFSYNKRDSKAMSCDSLPIPNNDDIISKEVGNIVLGKVIEEFQPLMAAFKTVDDVCPSFVVGYAGIPLAYYVFRPPSETPSNSTLLLITGYHWGRVIADRLSNRFDITVFICALRGCGLSGGKRGDVASSEHMLRDIRTMVRLIRHQVSSSTHTLVLGGLDRTGMLVLNYHAWPEHEPVDAYAFIAPFFEESHKNSELSGSLKKVVNSKSQFLSKLTRGFVGTHTISHQFNLNLVEYIRGNVDPEFISERTAAFEAAFCCPNAAEILESMDSAVIFCIGSDDRFVLNQKVLSFVNRHLSKNMHSSRRVISSVPTVNHFDLFVRSDEYIGPFITYIADSKCVVERSIPFSINPPLSLKDFERICVIGTGAFAEVSLAKYCGVHVNNENEDSKYKSYFCALKVMSKIHLAKLHHSQHVVEERRLLEKLDHTFIIRLLGRFQSDSHIYLVTEFAIGGELFTFLKLSHRLPASSARFYVAEITLALEYLHSRRIIYRDLKPENVMLDSVGHIKVVDMGFAKLLNPGENAHSLIGTPNYIAPEVILKLSQGYSFEVDWWSLGILCFELLTGYVPFASSNLHRLYELIFTNKPTYPSYLPKVAIDFMRRIITVDRSHRLTAEGVRKHAWFTDIDWDRLLLNDILPPYTPSFSSSGDPGNFISYSDDDTPLANISLSSIPEADLDIFKHF